MAQGDGNRLIRNAPYRLTFPIVNSALALQSSPGSLDSEISIDGGTFTDCTNEATEIGSTGIFTLDLTESEMIGDEFFIKVTSTNGVPTVLALKPEMALESGLATAGGASSITLRAGASAVDDFYNGGTLELVRGTGAGQTRSIIDYAGGTLICTADRAWATNPDSTTVYRIVPSIGPKLGTDILAHSNIQKIVDTAGAAVNLEAVYQGGMVVSSVDDASATTTSWIGASGLSTTDDFYNQGLLVFTTGALAGLARKILDYTGSTLTIEVSSAFPSAPANGAEFMIISRVE